MTLPRVVVLMATYNGACFLKEQINSVLRQKDVDVYLYVRDDGSSDETQKILNDYMQNGSLKWYTGERLKAAYSFFDLLNNAPEADYYAFCDQDDVWDDNKLKISLDYLSKTEKPYRFYCSGTRLVDKNLVVLKEHKLDTNRSINARFLYPGISGNTIVLNSELRKKIITYKPKNLIMHDNYCFQLALCLDSYMYLDSDSHISYRMHDNNVVGMELSIKDKIKKFFKIVTEKETYAQLMEIKNTFQIDISPKLLYLLKLVEDNKTRFLCRLKLAYFSDIDFNNLFFNIAFRIKVMCKYF